MKSIIYSSLIAAVVLCSCKGNSYMKQRYTHFSHGAKKTNQEAVAFKASPKAAVILEAVQPAPAPEQLQEPTASAANVVTEQHMTSVAVAKQNSHFQLPKIKDISRVVTLPSQQVAKAGFEKQAATKAHRGLIFGLIDLALFIILVAVVVAAVIFLVVLL